MAVPKRKVSRSRRNHRRSHHRLKFKESVVEEKSTGALRLRHHMSTLDGYYKGRKILLDASDLEDAGKESSEEAES